MSRSFPKGLEYRVIYNPTKFISESVSAVQHTLLEAVVLVVIVILVFLQSWRAAIIPVIAIPVSLIGTFAVLAARSEEHTSELQSLMRISYAVFCLKKKNKHHNHTTA